MHNNSSGTYIFFFSNIPASTTSARLRRVGGVPRVGVLPSCEPRREPGLRQEGNRSALTNPMEEKQVYANDSKAHEGHVSRLGVNKEAILDWGDYFFLHLLPVPSITHLSLGLAWTWTSSRLPSRKGDDVGATLRVNYYPKCTQQKLALGLSAHADPSGLTVLLADDCVIGLQVCKGDRWVTVQPVPVPSAFIPLSSTLVTRLR
ncbi:hypothetical protein Cni_G10215 [Canna indica]|uniref:Isopenicillin N synthase-like Fe(2+) 2OG dioxygenase domain-containing protein n=1 Tax=Canna indica TaxID=4628 RepID=A0AAQ3Q8D5_9LILI|nr:hypothetical protein Cni_G10215 [Canna indica]